MLNPDGASLYTRENANKVDLNRFSRFNTARVKFWEKPELLSWLLLQPTWSAYYLWVNESGKPATMSFLAPSYNDERSMIHV
jgi:hypothetical protein